MKLSEANLNINLLTNNGQIKGIIMKDGQLYINASYINSGTISANLIEGGTFKVGGSGNGKGVIYIYDSSNSVKGMVDQNGLEVTGTDNNLPIKTRFNAGGLTSYINNQVTASIFPAYGSGEYATVLGAYKAFYMLAGAGGSIAFRFAGTAGNGSYGAPFYFGLSVNVDAKLLIKGNEVASSSSRRYKHDIKRLTDKALDPHKLLDLRIIQFVYNDGDEQYHDTKGKVLPGFIAEEVEEAYPSAVIHNQDGSVESWDERRIIPGMLALIQEQDRNLKSLEERLLRLEKALSSYLDDDWR